MISKYNDPTSGAMQIVVTIMFDNKTAHCGYCFWVHYFIGGGAGICLVI